MENLKLINLKRFQIKLEKHSNIFIDISGSGLVWFGSTRICPRCNQAQLITRWVALTSTRVGVRLPLPACPIRPSPHSPSCRVPAFPIQLLPQSPSNSVRVLASHAWRSGSGSANLLAASLTPFVAVRRERPSALDAGIGRRSAGGGRVRPSADCSSPAWSSSRISICRSRPAPAASSTAGASSRCAGVEHAAI